jgi:hypothetical protein
LDGLTSRYTAPTGSIKLTLFTLQAKNLREFGSTWDSLKTRIMEQEAQVKGLMLGLHTRSRRLVALPLLHMLALR